MDVINVIEVVDNVPLGIKSFSVVDDQLISEVVNQAEQLLVEIAKENGLPDNEDEIETVLSEGNYTNGNYHVTIIWSEVDN